MNFDISDEDDLSTRKEKLEIKKLQSEIKNREYFLPRWLTFVQSLLPALFTLLAIYGSYILKNFNTEVSTKSAAEQTPNIVKEGYGRYRREIQELKTSIAIFSGEWLSFRSNISKDEATPSLIKKINAINIHIGDLKETAESMH
jgi:hypothetical protein